MYVQHLPNILLLFIRRQSLFVLKAGANVAELLVDAKPLLLLVLAIANVADEHRETSHAR